MRFVITFLLCLLLTGCTVERIHYDIIVTEVPVGMDVLNSAYNDCNASLLFPADSTEIQFSSDRNSPGVEMALFGSTLAFTYYEDHNVLNLSVSGSVNEKPGASCGDNEPSLMGDFKVFAIETEGRYDLWYTKKYDNTWLEPIRLNPPVNSLYNEYNPFLFKVLGHELMVFSSDRPGGKGGYDLYIVKIGNYLN
jgi:hypothetical protein